jgi:enoyl-CoA hydratase/carnithine racemase
VDEVLAADVKRGVAVLTLNRPDARNALSAELLGKLEEALAGIAADRTIGVVVFCGSGPFFCAGGDLKERATLPPQGGHESLESRSRREGELLATIKRQPQLTLVAVDGGAIGAGLGIVCACDLAITTKNSLFQAPEVRTGALPAQVAPVVVECVGWRHARRLLLSGERIDADEAHRIGLVQEVVADRVALGRALEIRLADLTTCNPTAVAGTKALLERITPSDHSYAAFAAKAYIAKLTPER